MPQPAPEGAVPPRLHERSSGRVWTWLALAVGGVGLVLLFVFNPAQHGFYPTCQFHQLTGWDCPGCGGLRATHFLLHGEIGRAFRLNPLLVLALPLVVGWAAYALWAGRTRRRVRLPEKAAYISAVVILLFGVLRNLNW
jgi:drug/metabolite transporter (DMT)-like permease